MLCSSYSGELPTDLAFRVIQEGLLNQSGVLLWGDHEMSLRDFSSALGRLMEWSYFDDSYRQSFSWISQHPSSPAHKDGYDIFRVLQWVRCRHCLDDRDRIFAILGLQYHARYPWNASVRNVKPDYSRSMDDLYVRLAYDISKLGGTLRLLNSVHHGCRLPAWAEGAEPSWVPKWNEHLTSDLEHEDTRGRSIGFGPRRYCLIYPTSINFQQKSIVVECVRYDIVALVSESLLCVDGESQNAESTFAFWCKALRSIHAGRRSTPLAYAWTTIQISDVICGTKYLWENSFGEINGARNLLKILRWQQNVQDVGEAEQLANRQLCNMITKSLQTMKGRTCGFGDESSHGRLFHPTERQKHRRLFLTQRNQIGLGPEAMRPGDIVVNLKGSTLPFIVRPQGSFYQFVGATRMPESMRRDAIVQAEREGAKMEVIEIR
jgi:hypothetical protein